MKKRRLRQYLILLGLVLGLKDGCVALIRNGVPIQIYPLEAKYLPQADQKLLETGIPIHDKNELSQILEDYLS